MCGIIGYIGNKESAPILLEGLKRLEYRGYDSAGIAVLNSEEVRVIRRKGHLEELEKALGKENFTGTIGVGHTRWATHGRPSEVNAHPHLDCKGHIALVHNGIIENFSSLKDELKSRGHKFNSETDTEVIVHLVEENYDGDLLEALRKATQKLEGSFAVALISEDEPDRIVAARKDSPLVLGKGNEEYFVASDIPAILSHTKEVLILENGEVALLTKDGIKIETFEGKPVERDILKVTWDIEAAEKSGYEDFMLKEIYEQPQALRDTLRGRITKKGANLSELKLSPQEVKGLNKVFVIACGTSYHAGLLGKLVIERWARLPVEIEISSEFRYRNPIIDDKTLVVAITQSGETADTLAGIKGAKEQGGKVIAITNVVGSSITREADGVIYTHAGPEIGVAATKTLLAQMAALYVLGLYLGKERGVLKAEKISQISEELEKLPEQVREVLEDISVIEECSKKYASYSNFLFLGRGVGLPVAMEGALKLKEISYIHAEGYPAGEMKHGPIALIDGNMPVVVVAPRDSYYDKVVGNIQEVRARGAQIIAVATSKDAEIKRHVDHIFYIPELDELLSPVVATIPLQLLAYHIAKIRGCNVDQPRNLAKSVTVE